METKEKNFNISELLHFISLTQALGRTRLRHTAAAAVRTATAAAAAAQRAEEVPVLTDAPETLGQSSPQLFHFASFLGGLRGRHLVAQPPLRVSLKRGRSRGRPAFSSAAARRKTGG